jgi:PKD repeat protein
LEGSQEIGNVVVDYITARQSDGRIVAGTHGRGAFVANAGSGGGNAVASVEVSNLTLRSRPGQTGSTSFYLYNDGQASLNYNISVEGSFGSALTKISNTNLVLHKADISSNEFNKYRNKLHNQKKSFKKATASKENNKSKLSSPLDLSGSDNLYNDDGNGGADDFFGYGNGSDLYVYNEFNVSGFNFTMDAFDVFLRTESQFTNLVYAAIYDANFNLLSEGSLSFNLSSTGSWYNITLNPALEFNDGSKFFIEIGSTSFIPYPVGVDTDAQNTNKSFYFNWNSAAYENLNTISGFENGAFLIRASGTKSGGGNQNPVAVANVSKTQASVNETINFDASQSYDNDGSIAQYLWNFGDGSTSNQQIASHAYSQPNTYTYSLTVTDNKGATDQTGGQIVIGSNSGNLVTAEPSSGFISPGGSQLITLTLNAQTLQEGNYTGAVTISTNGGNIVIPIDYLVPVESITNVPEELYLHQNYPNPFNPTTTIEYSIPNFISGISQNVELKIYDLLGREVSTVVNKKQNPGIYKVKFEAGSLNSGIYIYRINYGSYSESKKMILLK